MCLFVPFTITFGSTVENKALSLDLHKCGTKLTLCTQSCKKLLMCQLYFSKKVAFVIGAYDRAVCRTLVLFCVTVGVN